MLLEIEIDSSTFIQELSSLFSLLFEQWKRINLLEKKEMMTKVEKEHNVYPIVFTEDYGHRISTSRYSFIWAVEHNQIGAKNKLLEIDLQ